MSPRAVLIPLLSIALLVGCASKPPQPTHEVQARPAQTMIVPGARSPLAKTIRQVLSGNGWQLTDYQGSGAHNTPADTQTMAERARYRVTLTASPAGACQGDEPSFMYRLSVIENASGRIALAMSGADCLDAIKQQFRRELAEEDLAPGTATSSSGRRSATH